MNFRAKACQSLIPGSDRDAGMHVRAKTRPNMLNFFYLVGSGITIQLMGTAYRIWLARRIGAEGLGIFQMTYPVYRLLSSLASLGLPLALTKWVAEYLTARDNTQILSLRRWSSQVVLSSSLIAAIILYLTAPFLSTHLFSEPRVGEALFIIAFAIPFSALSSIYRGYYQGFSQMAPTALSEVAEQLAEVSTAVLCLTLFAGFYGFSPYSAPVIGLTMGEVACLATLLCFLKRPGISIGPALPEIAIPRLEILHYSWPLLLNQVVVSISGASEGVLIPKFLLNSGASVAQSTQWLGFLNGMAAPVAFFPLIILFPLGTVLSPQISAGIAAGSWGALRSKVRRFYALTTTISLGFFTLIFFNASDLARILYHSDNPVTLIKLLVLGMPFSALAILNSSILASSGATDKILGISLWSVGLKTGLLFLTLYWGIHGAALAITMTQIFASLVSTLELRMFFTKLDA
jgi:stage V sporulation protein B